MKIEIIKAADNNPVAEFFSSSDTPETDSKEAWPASKLKLGNDSFVPAEFARRLERERDEWHFRAHENFKFTLDARAERDEARDAAKKAKAYKRVLKETNAQLKRERDEARAALANETSFHHRTHSELVEAQCKLMDATQAIITTLEENRHFADGDDCTLAKLKLVVSEWK